MKQALSRTLATLLLASGFVLLSGSAREPILKPDKLVILSTTDVKGKTVPCGCHIPKGGLSRRASYIDSVRTTYGQVLVVDNGGFFPEDEPHRDAAPFMIDAMMTLGIDAVNVGTAELRFGLEYLQQRAGKVGLPLVSANLLDPRTRKTIFKPYLIKKVGTVTVGVFGLASAKGDLGPARDSLVVEDPATVARNVVPELRRKGAQVVVLLSQLGKMEGEDLVANVNGIDAVMLGRDLVLMQRGRMVKNTIACYGGEQGHYVCRTEVALDPKRHMASAEAEAVILGPEVPDKPPIYTMVKAFEDALNGKLEKVRKEKEAEVQVKAPPPDASPPPPVGAK